MCKAMKNQSERCLIMLNDGYEQTLKTEKKALFQKYLNLMNRKVKTTDEEMKDEEIMNSKQIIRLYRCCHTTTKYRIEEIKPGPLQQSDLNSNVSKHFTPNALWPR